MTKSYALSMFAAAFITTGIAASPDAPAMNSGFAPLSAALVIAPSEAAPAEAQPVTVARRVR